MIRVERVGKRFGRTTALCEVSFAVERGEVVGFVGPNGAGKTTTLRIITGYLDPDEGRVFVDDHDVVRERAAAQARIGYLPESVPLHSDMRVEEYLRFRARLKGVPRARIPARLDEVTRRCAIDDQRARVIGELSKGYRQRVGLADALVAAPPILILDEPTSGLDPVQVREFRQLLADLATEHTVLLSSHILPEIEATTSRVVVIARGRVVGNGTPAALRREAGLGDDASLEDVFIALAEDRAEEG